MPTKFFCYQKKYKWYSQKLYNKFSLGGRFHQLILVVLSDGLLSNYGPGSSQYSSFLISVQDEEYISLPCVFFFHTPTPQSLLDYCKFSSVFWWQAKGHSPFSWDWGVEVLWRISSRNTNSYHILIFTHQKIN